MKLLWSNIHLTLPSIWTSLHPFYSGRILKNVVWKTDIVQTKGIQIQMHFLQYFRETLSRLIRTGSLLCFFHFYVLYSDFCVCKCEFPECYYVLVWVIWEIKTFTCFPAFTVSGIWKIASQCSQIHVIRSLSDVDCSYLYV